MLGIKTDAKYIRELKLDFEQKKKKKEERKQKLLSVDEQLLLYRDMMWMGRSLGSHRMSFYHHYAKK